MENITTPIRGSNPAVQGTPISPEFSENRPIVFGTDGWRGRIAEEITLSRLRRCAAGIAAYLGSAGREGSPVVLGYDGRFLAERFAREVAGVLVREGFVAILSPEPVPTPALSLRVVTARASLGIMITASHNPPEYGGLKLKDSQGGTLDPEETGRMTRFLPDSDPGARAVADLPHHPSFLPSYLRALGRRVALRAIRRAPLRVVVDSMHGMGTRLLEQILAGGRPRVRTLRADPDPLFGGVNPEPIPQHVGLLLRSVPRDRAAAGIATDGDADRIAACDERGRYLSPLTLLPLLAVHLVEGRGETGGIAKTFAGTLRMERIARRYGLPFYDLPVGFKHVAALLRREAILLGGEESGGFGFRGFLPERDGLLSALMILEAMVLADLPLSRLVARMEKEFGRYRYDRIDLACSREAALQVVGRLLEAPPRRIGGMRVTDVSSLDGVKFLFGEDGWILFRPSGTEPVLRLYCEAPTAAAVAAALRQGVRLTRL